MMPPRMSTVRVVPTPRGCGLVEVTLVIALAQRGQASASASTETFAGKLQVTIRENHRSTRPIRSAARLSLGRLREMKSPASLTAAVTEANTFYTQGNTLATEIASLPSTDYADTALDNALQRSTSGFCPTRFSSSPIWRTRSDVGVTDRTLRTFAEGYR
jgi:hypothetical protein